MEEDAYRFHICRGRIGLSFFTKREALSILYANPSNLTAVSGLLSSYREGSSGTPNESGPHDRGAVASDRAVALTVFRLVRRCIKHIDGARPRQGYLS